MRAIADASQDIAHGIAAHLVEAEVSHASTDSIANRANLAVKAGDGYHVAQELNDGVVVLCQFLLHSGLRFT